MMLIPTHVSRFSIHPADLEAEDVKRVRIQ